MPREPDPRVPVLAGSADRPAGWTELAVPADRHLVVGCACCAPRGPLARALASVWLRAVRAGDALPGVMVRGTTPEALAALLRDDAICAARFRTVG